MLRGHVSSIGNLEVDGDKVVGIFIECDIVDLKNYGRNLAFKDVIVIEDQEGTVLRIEKEPTAKTEEGQAIT